MSGEPSRRGLGAALATLAVGAGLLLLAAGRGWAVGTERRSVAGTFLLVHHAVTGHALSGTGTAAGVLGLAGLAAVPAVRGVVRRIVAALLVLAGVAATIVALQHAGSAPAGLRATGWPEVSAVGGLLLAAAGVQCLVRGRAWPGLSRRHDAPALRAPSRSGPTGLWDALDRGEDPTGAPAADGPPVRRG